MTIPKTQLPIPSGKTITYLTLVSISIAGYLMQNTWLHTLGGYLFVGGIATTFVFALMTTNPDKEHKDQWTSTFLSRGNKVDFRIDSISECILIDRTNKRLGLIAKSDFLTECNFDDVIELKVIQNKHHQTALMLVNRNEASPVFTMKFTSNSDAEAALAKLRLYMKQS